MKKMNFEQMVSISGGQTTTLAYEGLIEVDERWTPAQVGCAMAMAGLAIAIVGFIGTGGVGLLAWAAVGGMGTGTYGFIKDCKGV